MAKIKLGQRPQTFKPVPVKFEMPDGTDGVITCTFKYRTRSEWGALVDLITGAGNDPGDEKFSWEALMKKAGDANGDYLMEVLHAWDLDEELDRESLQALADELPAGAAAIMAAYATACRDGRLGN